VEEKNGKTAQFFFSGFLLMQGLNLVEELLKTYMTMIAFIQEMRKYTAFD